MDDGRQRNLRAIAYAQAALVWNFKEIDASDWIEHGNISMRPGKFEPVELDPQLEADVRQYIERIKAAGKFVMPEA